MGKKVIIPGLKRSNMKVLKLNKNIGFDSFEKMLILKFILEFMMMQ